MITTAKDKKKGDMLRKMAKFYGGMGPLANKVSPVVKIVLTKFGNELAVQLENSIEEKAMSLINDGRDGNLRQYIDVDMVIVEIDRLMTDKLEQLTPEMVKGLLDEVQYLFAIRIKKL